jgi:proline dehydrogenase
MATIDRLLAPDSLFSRRFFFLARRFVAGSTIASAMDAVRGLNAQGMTGTLDFLGEDVTDVAEARHTRDVYFDLLETGAREGLRTNVSVKLTALEIVERAAPLQDPFVRIDMEGSAVTDATLRVFERVFAQHRNVGPVLQAYLKRTPGDVERAIELGVRVRLCKGAYSEPETIAYRDMPTIRREYMRCAEALVSRGHYPGIATHDERLIEAVKAYAAEQGIDKDRFEFQLLYGVRPDVQRALVGDGYNVRVYVPFGTHWAGYFYRRVTERPENALFALRSMLGR